MKKIVHEFISFTNLKHNRCKLIALLVIPSLLYSILYALVNTIIYMGNPIYYYLALYIFVIWAAYVYMILIFQFIQTKRENREKLQLKSYILPLLGVQSIFFILLIGSGLLTQSVAGSVESSMLYYVLTPCCIIFTIFYVPLQVFSFFVIYDGECNPLKIIWKALKKLFHHYRTCFYALLSLVLVVLFYQIILQVCFAITSPFVSFLAVQDVMVASNPLVNAVNYMLLAFQNSSLWMVVLVSVIYGIIMCILLVYYYMVMLCAYDEDIKI